MNLTYGIDETFYKTFILTEDRLKEFHRLLENAAQRFPAPAGLIYTIVHSDFRYFKTKRIQDVTHDLDVQQKSIIQLIMEADFENQTGMLEGNKIIPPPENWHIRVAFNIPQKDFWDGRADRISLRVKSEDRKWANDYIDKFENLIYKLPSGEKIPTVIFWLYALPLVFFIQNLFKQLNAALPSNWYAYPLPRILFFFCMGISAFMLLVGIMVNVFQYRPHGYRILFGPTSSFVWGAGNENHDFFKRARHVSLWGIGCIFLVILSASFAFVLL